MNRILIAILLVLALATLACGLHVRAPLTQQTGPLTTDQINIAVPDANATADLKLSFGAGTIHLAPGAQGLVTGTATYNISDFKPDITTTANSVHIEQGNFRLTGIPDFSNIRNEWDLQLGSSPMNLTIEGGAYTGEYALGGLALTNLTVEEGASKVELSFDQPGTTEMKLFRYKTGASNVRMTGLANANFASMEFTGGAGNYTFDFSGQLQRDTSVTIEAGLSNVTLVIPSGLPAQVTVNGLSNVSHNANWTKNGDQYSQSGSGPQLVILVEMGAGNLTITP
jgi:N-terminal domain of toast_rack, DUF2154